MELYQIMEDNLMTKFRGGESQGFQMCRGMTKTDCSSVNLETQHESLWDLETLASPRLNP